MSLWASDGPAVETKRKSDAFEDPTTERTALLNPVNGVDRVQDGRPLLYGSINTSEQDADISPEYNQRLNSHSDSPYTLPTNVAHEDDVTTSVEERHHTQSSVVTIFSIWNTMLGTSILSMPWALESAGFGLGICLMIFMGGLSLYTAYRILKSKDYHGLPKSDALEFSDICSHYLGPWGEYLSIIFSVLSLVGAAIVYWILMSNFLYNSVLFIYEKVNNEFNTTSAAVINDSYTDVICPHPPPHNNFSLQRDHLHGLLWKLDFLEGSSSHDTFHKVWSQYITVPFFLIVVLVPLINFKSPTFFTKFNALGTISIAYIATFITAKAAHWGVHMKVELGIPEFKLSFPALTGILALAFFIHNCILSIMKNQRHPENNGRDLSIAFSLVTLTYVFVGVLFYITFPMHKSCIEDNLLNNFVNSDILAFTARIFLFLQMVTVFPLLLFILRAQLLNLFFKSIYPSWKHVLALNIIVVAICLLFATQLPNIGTIIRFSGAMCGLVYIFTLPCVVYMLALKKRSSLTWPIITVHVVIILLGVCNFIAQFLILGMA